MAKLDQISINGTTYEMVPEIAPLFDATQAYAAGDCVIKDAVLYRFTVAHAAGAWIGTDAEEVTVSEELTNLKEDLSELNDRIFSRAVLSKTINAVSGSSILATASKIDMSVPANTPITIVLIDDEGAVTNYNVYLNGTTQKYNCLPNEEYTFTKNVEVTKAEIYSNTVVKTGSVVFRVEYGKSSDIETIENKIDTNSKNIENLFDSTDALKSVPQLVNLYDYTKVAEGDVNSNTGEIGSGYYHTDYIPVKKGITYYVGVIVSNRSVLYDTDKKYISAISPTSIDDFSETWKFTPSQDGFFRGTLYSTNTAAFGYVCPFFNSFRPYTGDVDFSYASDEHENILTQKALGGKNSNLFEGGSNYGAFNTNTHVIKYDPARIVTPFIPISKHLYWIFREKIQGCIQYLYEYDSDKTFIKTSTLSGSWLGWKALDANTAYIRLSTNSMSNWERVLTPAEFDELLYVADNITKLNKFVPPSTDVIHRDGTAWDFYNRTAVFYNDYVDNAISSYKSEIERAGYDFVMALNTDLHTLNPEPFNMLTYMSESGVADVCFNLGDNIREEYESGEEAAFNNIAAIHLWSNSPYKKCPLIVLRGNHDNHPITGSVTDKNMLVSNAQYYNAMQSRTQKGFAGINKNYGYLDFEQSKIRVIFLDSGDIYDDNGEPLTSGFNVTVRQEQLDWFCNVALNFMDKEDRREWSVITCSHAQLKQLAEETFNAILYAFINGTAASGTQTKSYADTGKSEVLTYNVDFTSQGEMEYICHINGHNHWDGSFIMGNTGRYDIDICSDVNNGGVNDGTTTTPYTYTAGTIDERCMSTLCLNKSDRSILIKRLGVGSDRTFNY